MSLGISKLLCDDKRDVRLNPGRGRSSKLVPSLYECLAESLQLDRDKLLMTAVGNLAMAGFRWRQDLKFPFNELAVEAIPVLEPLESLAGHQRRAGGRRHACR